MWLLDSKFASFYLNFTHFHFQLFLLVPFLFHFLGNSLLLMNNSECNAKAKEVHTKIGSNSSIGKAI